MLRCDNKYKNPSATQQAPDSFSLLCRWKHYWVSIFTLPDPAITTTHPALYQPHWCLEAQCSAIPDTTAPLLPQSETLKQWGEELLAQQTLRGKGS